VGHETDFTITDFVADIRAPTPTGASQLVCQDREELLRRAKVLYWRTQRELQRGIESRMQNADMLACRLVHPRERINDQLTHLQRLHARLTGSCLRYSENRYWRVRELNQRVIVGRPDFSRLIERQYELGMRLHRAIAGRIETLATTLEHQQANLAHLNPQSVLQRGYSIAYTADGTVLRNSDQVGIGEAIRVAFAKGKIKANVSEKDE
jgi:exodeoxyribonuclease VII large subunit